MTVRTGWMFVLLLLGGWILRAQEPVPLRDEVDRWASWLLAEDLALRETAWRRIIELGEGAREIVRQLAEQAEDPLRERLLELLRELDARAALVLEARRLESEDPAQRDAARVALAEIPASRLARVGDLLPVADPLQRRELRAIIHEGYLRSSARLRWPAPAEGEAAAVEGNIAQEDPPPALWSEEAAEYQGLPPLAMAALRERLDLGEMGMRRMATVIWGRTLGALARRLQAAGQGEPGDDPVAWGFLVAPGLEVLARRGDTSALRERAAALLESIIVDELEGLDDGRERVRRLAGEALFTMGGCVEGPLLAWGRSAEPHRRELAEVLLRRIRLSISEPLMRRVGGLLEDLDSGDDWRRRRSALFRVARLGQNDAQRCLRVVMRADASLGMRVAAASALARLGDEQALFFLARLGRDANLPSPVAENELRMAQGIRYLEAARFREAEAEFLAIVRAAPENVTAHYNLACTYSLWGKTDQALEALEQALERGFDDFEHIDDDPDLDPLRADPRFAQLLSRFRKE